MTKTKRPKRRQSRLREAASAVAVLAAAQERVMGSFDVEHGHRMSTLALRRLAGRLLGRGAVSASQPGRWAVKGLRGLVLPSLSIGGSRIFTRECFLVWCRELSRLRPGDDYPTGGRPVLDAPSFRLHRPSGRAVVTIGTRDIYLGKYGTKEARDTYKLFMRRWRRVLDLSAR